jgi:hypothetical protein
MIFLLAVGDAGGHMMLPAMEREYGSCRSAAEITRR